MWALIPIIVCGAASLSDAQSKSRLDLGDFFPYEVTIRTDPPDAEIRIVDSSQKFQNGKAMLRRGTYRVEVSKPGYKTRVEEINIAGENLSLTIRLEPLSQPSTKPKLFIKTIPQSATIQIMNISEKFYQGISLEPGSYHIQASASGYQTYNQWIDIQSGPDVNLDIRLEPIPEKGSLFISATPSDVTIEFLNANETFRQGIELKPNEYHLKASKTGYISKDFWVKIVPGEATRAEVRLDDTPSQSVLIIKTEPENATVRFLDSNQNYYDGVKLDPGTYHIEVSADDYKSESRWIEAKPGEMTRLTIPLQPSVPQIPDRQGKLFVTTRPPDANIQIMNIKPKFEQGMFLEPGPYRLKVTAPGYYASEKWIEINAGDVTNVDMVLDAVPQTTGALTVSTDPQNAKIELLNSSKAYEPGVTLDRGTYQLRVSADGYKPFERRISIATGEDKKLHVQLEVDIEKGRLFVKAEPRNAKIRLPEIKDVFHQGISLDPGKYKVSVTAPKYNPSDIEVEIKPKTDTNVDIALIPVESPQPRKRPPFRCAIFPWILKKSGSSYMHLILDSISTRIKRYDNNLFTLDYSFYPLSNDEIKLLDQTILSKSVQDRLWSDPSFFSSAKPEANVVAEIARKYGINAVLMGEFSAEQEAVDIWAETIRIYLIDTTTENVFSTRNHKRISIYMGDFKNEVDSMLRDIFQEYEHKILH